MSIDAVVKCLVSEDGKHITPCTHLANCVAGRGQSKVKGVVVWQTERVKDIKPYRTFYGVKSGAHSARGIAFNFCPFCGVQVDAPFAEDADKDRP